MYFNSLQNQLKLSHSHYNSRRHIFLGLLILNLHVAILPSMTQMKIYAYKRLAKLTKAERCVAIQ